MPKGKKKRKDGHHLKVEPPGFGGSEDESNFDNASVISQTSESKYGSEDGTVGEPDNNEEGSVYDDFEEKLKEAVDGITQKSARGRQNCLEAVLKALTTRYLFEFLSDRKFTIFDTLEKNLRKGKNEEQGIAAFVAAVVCIHLGPEESVTLFNNLKPFMITIMNDPSASLIARSKCAESLGLCCFITANDVEAICSTMEMLHSVFSASFFKGNGVAPSHSPEITNFHSNALASWTLLLTLLSMFSPKRSAHIADSNLRKMVELLESTDVELRITAGETIAVMSEVLSDADQYFDDDLLDDLCEKLRNLATDCQKFRAKKERRQQRSSFRDVLKAVQDREAPDIRVKFGREVLMIQSWCRKRQYDAFCHVLASGMNLHLSENDLLREIFELGEILDNSVAVHKASKFERHMVNVAADKFRTVTRGKLRDKRADVLG